MCLSTPSNGVAAVLPISLLTVSGTPRDTTPTSVPASEPSGERVSFTGFVTSLSTAIVVSSRVSISEFSKVGPTPVPYVL